MDDWRLKRTKQCDKCPWKVDTDPYDIPNGYDVDKHKALEVTIAKGHNPFAITHAMSCHEHPPNKEVYCVGWLVNQLGIGNNISLRMQMLSCTNSDQIVLDGDQHERFEDTLPNG